MCDSESVSENKSESVFHCLFDWVNQSYLRLLAQDSMVPKVLSPPLWGDWDFLFILGKVGEKFIDNIKEFLGNILIV